MIKKKTNVESEVSLRAKNSSLQIWLVWCIMYVYIIALRMMQ